MPGLYIHIPFCAKKCAYCNFYSACCTDSVIGDYLRTLKEEIKKWGGSMGRPFSSVYIGGGTPSVLGEKILPLMEDIRESFCLTADCEITAEINPAANVDTFLSAAKKAGINRLSIGMQSGIDRELKILGRTHTAEDARRCFYTARELGFNNISLDLMTGLPESNIDTLNTSLDFLSRLDPEHISAYILKVEDKTQLAARRDLRFADEDTQAEQYIYTCEYLESKGYSHYEISNFAKPGYEGQHNLKYWRCEEYLGLGPAAHSFLEGERFFYPADLKEFIKNPHTVSDGTGGGAQEYLMLNLRLRDGIDLKAFAARFNLNPTPELTDFLKLLSREGLISLDGEKFHLTDKGMLLSNTVITEILERLL